MLLQFCELIWEFTAQRFSALLTAPLLDAALRNSSLLTATQLLVDSDACCRPTIPTALKLISGTYRADQANLAEPTPAAGIPAQPANLSYGAKRAWKNLSVMLDNLGVLTKSDGLALASLCEAVDDLAKARRSLKARDGLTYENVTAAGGITWRPWPELRLISEADHRMQTWLAKFGLSPVDRAKVSVIEKETSDPAKRYFR